MSTNVLPTVAIVGRPNVGKSTLFNRLAGKRLALVHDLPGMTRDWREASAKLGDLRFKIVDTAGFDKPDVDELTGKMLEQTKHAIEKSDIIIFVMDARDGMTPLDKHYSDLVRRASKPIILIANKCERREHKLILGKAAKLGFGEALPLSAEHGEGLNNLYDALAELITPIEIEAEEEAEKHLQLAIVGRPNVGKSTLVNALLQEERVLTSDMPGVTRDAIAIDWEYQGRPIRLIDTAGLRRRPKVTEKLEKLAISDALRAIDFAQVVILVLDHETPLSKQDAMK